jgi:hypothetical protein
MTVFCAGGAAALSAWLQDLRAGPGQGTIPGRGNWGTILPLAEALPLVGGRQGL